jgi:hypothetical protein
MKPSDLTSLAGASAASGDLFVVTDVSASEDKKMTLAELLIALGVDATSALDIASVAATGAIKSSGAAGGIGYATGAGGTVIQGTSKSTGVTLSKACGTITLHNAALAADAIVSFTLTNTSIAAGDLLLINHISGGTPGAYTFNAICGAGSASINVANRSAGSLSESPVLAFALIKGVTA